MNRLLLHVLVVLSVLTTACSPKTSSETKSWNQNGISKYWRDTDTLSVKLYCKDRIFPKKFRILDANYDELKKLLIREGAVPGSLSPDTILITIPMPDGTWEEYSISQVRVMSEELAAKYPDIKTYAGKSKIYPADNIRLDISQQGVRVMIQSTRGTIMLDPYCNEDKLHVISYYRKDLPENAKEDFEK